jgi:predicted phage baseplate assembly protein
MALEPVKLDDLTWSEMVTAIRRRIPAASDGKWTLHAPVDPGVTLLELFAWLLEQRVYWLDQVPDPLVRAALDLLGAEVPKPSQAATTVLVLSDRADPPRPFLTLSPLTEMRLRNRVPPLTFSTDTGVTLLPVDRVGLYVAGRDRTTDLEQGRVLRLFPANGTAAEVKIVLWLREPLPQDVPMEPLALLFDLRTPASILPQWSPNAVPDVPPPAKVTWWYSKMENGQLAPFKQVDDGTGGLRRSGVVRLWIPPNPTTHGVDWKPDEPPDPSTGSVPYALWIKIEHTTFTAPPRLERLIPNVAIARHLRRTQTHRLKQTWLSLPGNVIELAELPKERPDKDHPPLEQCVVLHLRERDNAWHKWEPSADLSFHGPGDRFFVVDREWGVLRFGDGLTGRLPVLAETDPEDPEDANVKVQYFVGGGSAGILGDNREWEGVREGGVRDTNLTAKNVVPTEGGAEPESIESARQRAAAALKRRDRAVTSEDYEEIARTTPGVAIKRAHAAIGYHPTYPCTIVPGAVTVFIVPDAPREEVDEDWVESALVSAPQPDPGAQAAVLVRLNEARLVTTEVLVRGPRYRPVALTVTVEGDPADPMELRRQIHKHLQDFLDPIIGGDDKEGWPFGEPLRPFVLLREAQRALDDSGAAVGVSIRLLDTELAAESCSDVKVGPHDLMELKEITIQFNRKVASSGGLR